MRVTRKRWWFAALALVVVAVAAVVGSQALGGSGGDALAGTKQASDQGKGLGRRAACCPAIT